MKAVVTGAGGQLGRALLASAPGGIEVVGLDRQALDITDAAAVSRLIRSMRPDLVINAAAYTAVEAAEDAPDVAMAVNAVAPEALAAGAAGIGAGFIQVSTDYVFDGEADVPYRPDAPARPLNLYGLSKREGEERALAAHPAALVVRTSTLYGEGGLMVRLLDRMAGGEPINVVDDQAFSPTFVSPFAHDLWALGAKGASGVLHLADEGWTSPYGFATAIREEALRLGLLGRAAQILAVSASAYGSAVRRPRFAALDSAAARDLLGRAGRPWRENLVRALIERRR